MKFATERELKNYVDIELSKALPSNWKVNYRLSRYGAYLEWEIVPPSNWIEKWGGYKGLWNDYLLQVTQDFSTFIIIHASNDASIGYHHFFRNAKVIQAHQLYMVSLSEIISHIINNYMPNTWGLT